MAHGQVQCSECKKYFSKISTENGFEVWGQGEMIRLINNPAIWGSAKEPMYYLLGFSKGDIQNKALADVVRGRARFEDVPFKGMRHRLKWLLEALGLIQPHNEIAELFEKREKKCSSSSLIKCSISVQGSNGKYSFKMKDILEADIITNGRVKEIAETCARKHLSKVGENRLFIMLGLDKKYIKICREVFTRLYGKQSSDSQIDYSSGSLTWIHVAHPSGNQTDPQYKRWVKAETDEPKVLWAKKQVEKRLTSSNC